MAKLNFKNEGLKRIVEISDNATEYRNSYSETVNKWEAGTGKTWEGNKIPAEYYRSTTPTLWLVKDEGIYLMSSAIVVRPKGYNNMVDVVYAVGYDPRAGDVYDKCREAVGGDDFVESIALTPEIREGIAAGFSMCIDFTQNYFEVALVKTAKI